MGIAIDFMFVNTFHDCEISMLLFFKSLGYDIISHLISIIVSNHAIPDKDVGM